MSRGQITLFIIIAVILIIIYTAIFQYTQETRLAVEVQKQVSFQSQVESLDDYMTQCSKQVLADSIRAVGLDVEQIADAVDANLTICINQSLFPGLSLSYATPSTEVRKTVNNRTILALIEFPITARVQEAQAIIEKFHISYDLERQVLLKISPFCTTDRDVLVQSVTEDISVIIPNGTVAITASGTCLNATDLNVFVKKRDEKNIGLFTYDIKPDGGIFSPAITIIINYQDNNNDGFVDGSTVPEENIQIRMYDEATDSWISLPTKNLDIINNTISTKIEHLSEYGIGRPYTFEVKASNPSRFPRQEIVHIRHMPPIGLLHKNNTELITAEWNGTELPTSYDLSTTKQYDNDFIRQVDILILDNYSALEKKEYTIKINNIPVVNLGDIPIDREESSEAPQQTGRVVEVQAGGRTESVNNIQYSIDNGGTSPRIKIDEALGSIAVEGLDWAYVFMKPVPQNILPSTPSFDGSEPPGQFTLKYGPPEVKAQANELMVVFDIGYPSPEIQTITQPAVGIPPADIIKGSAEIKVFRGENKVYLSSGQHILRDLHNHNGFGQGTLLGFQSDACVTIGCADSADVVICQSGPQKQREQDARFFGFDGTTTYYHVWINKYNVWNYVKDFFGGSCKKTEMRKTPFPSCTFANYYALGNEERAKIVYTPDFTNKMIKGSYVEDGCDHRIPFGKLSIVGDFISETFSETGTGQGWVRSQIGGDFSGRITIVEGLEPDEEVYSSEVERIMKPIQTENLRLYKEGNESIAITPYEHEI